MFPTLFPLQQHPESWRLDRHRGVGHRLRALRLRRSHRVRRTPAQDEARSVQVVQAEDLYFSDQLDDHKSRVFDDRLQLTFLEYEPNVSEAAVFVGVQAVAVVNKQLPLCGLDKYY